MTDIDHERSITGSDYCGGCGQDWPCQHEWLRQEVERWKGMYEQAIQGRDHWHERCQAAERQLAEVSFEAEIERWVNKGERSFWHWYNGLSMEERTSVTRYMDAKDGKRRRWVTTIMRGAIVLHRWTCRQEPATATEARGTEP